MEYEVVILGLFIFVVLLMIFHRKIEKIISNFKFGNVSSEYIYAHSLLMETGEILSRPPTDRYPDMETNQAKVKLYYQRLKDLPVEIGNSEPVNNEKVKPILVSVK
jgi:hypothetical protein